MDTIKNDKSIDALNEYMSAYSQLWNIHCAVLAAKDGQILFNNAYGLANQEHKVPNGIDTKFWIASITKTFTATAIMMLYEQGLVNVNDSISKYFAAYPETKCQGLFNQINKKVTFIVILYYNTIKQMISINLK